MFAKILKSLVVLLSAFLLSGCLATLGPRYGGEIGRFQDRLVENAVDAGTCGVSSLMDKAAQRLVARGNGYNDYANQANFIACRSQERAQRQQEYWQAEAARQQQYWQDRAEAERRRMEQRQDAPKCDYIESNGRESRSCTERVYGQWRR